METYIPDKAKDNTKTSFQLKITIVKIRYNFNHVLLILRNENYISQDDVTF